jgi:1-acyl-sn-glycerol-3-phosphate acyltransferase
MHPELNARVLRTSFVILVAAVWTLLCQIPVTLSVLFTFSGDSSAWMARKLWAPVILWAAGVKIEADPMPQLERGQPYVFMANHQSFFDVAAAYYAINHPFRYVAKKSLVYVPILGWYLLMSGHILIDRGNHRRALRSLHRAGEKIAKGISILIFPEGTRSPDGRIRGFKKGPFLLALLAQVPIVPVAIEGSRRVLAKGSTRVVPGTIRIRLGEPIPTKGLTMDDRDRLMTLVHERLLEAHRAIGGPQAVSPAVEGDLPGDWPGQGLQA